MAIPARHIRRIEIAQGLALDDDVFEDLIYRMADVNITIRIRRAIVQDELLASFGRRTDALVALLRLPLRKHQWLAFGHIATHGKCRIGEIQRILLLVFTHVL